eukprot:1158598-Pelagomonas_calceolata.AAC.2
MGSSRLCRAAASKAATAPPTAPPAAVSAHGRVRKKLSTRNSTSDVGAAALDACKATYERKEGKRPVSNEGPGEAKQRGGVQ